MKIKQKLNKIRVYIDQHRRRSIVLTVVFFVSFMAYIVAFMPRTVAFSYGGDNCISQLTIFPGAFKSSQNGRYQVTVTDMISVAGHNIMGKKICVTPLQAPKPGKTSVSLSLLGGPLARKTYNVETPAAPVVSVAALSGSAPVAESLKMPISAKDSVFGYALATGSQQASCRSGDKILSCDLSQMKLTQGEVYNFKLERTFKDYRETIAVRELKVLEAVKIEGSSVATGQIVYDKPTGFTLQTNKPILEAKVKLEKVQGDAMTAVQGVTVASTDKQITVALGAPLERSSGYRLTITYAKGADGSVLSEPFVIDFFVSGGPKVTGINIGQFGVSRDQLVVISLDQVVDKSRLNKSVHITGANGTTVTGSGGAISIGLGDIDACAAFTITLDSNLESEYGIASDQAWQFTSRTRCSTIATIGYSVQHRPISAYSFGSGQSVVLFTGAIHGGELSGKYIMDDWVAYLEEHAPEIPADKRVVVIPTINPDGVAARTRNNANGVNLNRNFATADWVADTALDGGGTEKGAGGSAAGSEPETVALVNFTAALGPRIVVNYHSQGSLVNSNDVGIAATFGQRYASMTGYSFVPSTNTEEALGYAVTGTYEDWLAARGTPAILIELPSHTGKYFSNSTDAIWSIVRS